MPTDYSFTQPIRYFKANDPYYYELDNIPLRQLEENILFTKRKLEGHVEEAAGKYLTDKSELSIYNIKQLRPTAIGGRTVKVNTGRYNARVNDAFDVSKPLTQLVTSTPTATPNFVPDLKVEWSKQKRDDVWNSFIGTSTAENAYNMNGLEIWHTFYLTPGGLGKNYGWRVRDDNADLHGAYPQYNGIDRSIEWPDHNFYSQVSPANTRPDMNQSDGYLADDLGYVHLAFVQMWRGVFRTAVVDFPESTIEIPAWSDLDFFYWDNSTGEDPPPKVYLDATQRIDLLVAYSLPVDMSSTTISDYSDGWCEGVTPNVTTLTTPTLGIIRGAGVGIGQNQETKTVGTGEGCPDRGIGGGPGPGTAKMVANKSDMESTANQGITALDGSKIHGSFPSPDDLLNLAPLLAVNTTVEEGDYQLIGQSILPIAYIVVNKEYPNVIANDIIDIRPFLRTTEFTYNERAGVAAANPPLSFANPAVGSWQLQQAVDVLRSEHHEHEEEKMYHAALYTDHIMGGLAYGVEGTLLTMCDYDNANGDGDNNGAPFGDWLQSVKYKSDDVTYDFSEFATSKAFLQSTDMDNRRGYLQYMYNEKQIQVKKWLSNVNTRMENLPGECRYLGLPPGDGSTGKTRNIPLYPEWDQPMGSDNYGNLMHGTKFSLNIPKETWWMSFEGQRAREDGTASRTPCYLPGASRYKVAGAGGRSLDVGGGFSFLDTPSTTIMTIVNKDIRIFLPDWVNDYDVQAHYTYCGPVTGNNYSNTDGVASVSLGSGLSVVKGPILPSDNGAYKTANFQITSITAPMPGDGMIEPKGRLEMKSLDGGYFKQAPPMAETKGGGFESGPFMENFLSYTVVAPGTINTRFGSREQLYTFKKHDERFLPKFGATFYPTVTFTIHGFSANSALQNRSYSKDKGNYTMYQLAGLAGKGSREDVLVNETEGPSMFTYISPTGAATKIDIRHLGQG